MMTDEEKIEKTPGEQPAKALELLTAHAEEVDAALLQHSDEIQTDVYKYRRHSGTDFIGIEKEFRGEFGKDYLTQWSEATVLTGDKWLWTHRMCNLQNGLEWMGTYSGFGKVFGDRCDQVWAESKPADKNALGTIAPMMNHLQQQWEQRRDALMQEARSQPLVTGSESSPQDDQEDVQASDDQERTRSERYEDSVGRTKSKS
jgi:hypothetical protein